MSHAPTPWIGLAALAAMFIIPFLPTWLFEGPRTIRHRPHRHICGDCGAPWTNDHTCTTTIDAAYSPLHGELRRRNRESSLNAGRRRGLLHHSALVAYPDRQGSPDGASGRTARTHPFAPDARQRPGKRRPAQRLALDT
jgi:hypothetical protein